MADLIWILWMIVFVLILWEMDGKIRDQRQDRDDDDAERRSP